VAVMVVPLVDPSTRTDVPVVMAAADVELVPFWYVVEDASLTVTFWPADVVRVKPDVDTLLTVPDDPPAAGPERALDPPPPGMPCPVVAEGDAAVEGEVAVAAVAQPESPITVASATAAINPLLLFGSDRRGFGWRVSLEFVRSLFIMALSYLANLLRECQPLP
jgi:hypothetical protein